MKKLKFLALGTALVAMGTFAVSYFGAGEAEAQSSASSSMCTWNGKDCFDPFTTNYCLCETVTE
jgi:hypothetical protein